jgi:hypothetical protein
MVEFVFEQSAPGGAMLDEMTAEAAANWLTLLGYAGASIAFLFAWNQYRKDQTWKRRESIAALVEKIEQSPLSRNATTMLDYSLRWIHLNAHQEQDDKVEARVSYAWSAGVLIPHEMSDRPQLGAEGALIRDCFDDFLSQLDFIQSMIDAELLTAEDVRPYLDYWADAITDVEQQQPIDPEMFDEWALKRNLYLYICTYKFKRAKVLCESISRPFAFERGKGEDAAVAELTAQLAEECKRGIWKDKVSRARTESDDRKKQRRQDAAESG